MNGQKDADGKPFYNAMIQVAETKGLGWVDYMFPRPGQTAPSQKWTYVKKVTVDGVPGLGGLRILSRMRKHSAAARPKFCWDLPQFGAQKCHAQPPLVALLCLLSALNLFALWPPAIPCRLEQQSVGSVMKALCVIRILRVLCSPSL